MNVVGARRTAPALDAAAVEDQASPAPTRGSLTRDAWRRFTRHRLGLVGAGIVVAFVLLAILAPLVAPYGPTEMKVTKRLVGPSFEHLFGTDEFGRDILSRVLHGAAISFQVGIIAVGLASFVGTLLGLVAGYAGGWLDGLIMRCMDVLFAFPAILLAIAIVAMLGSSLENVMLAIGVVYTPIFARVVRGSTLSVKHELYVTAARALGGGAPRIVGRHILPNVVAPLIVQGSLNFAFAVLAEASLGFLGLGNRPPSPSWGSMLSTSYGFMEQAPWAAVFPGVAIMLAVLGFNLLGDGLRDALDPRLT